MFFAQDAAPPPKFRDGGGGHVRHSCLSGVEGEETSASVIATPRKCRVGGRQMALIPTQYPDYDAMLWLSAFPWSWASCQGEE